MKKIIKEVNRNITQVTIADERWYVVRNQYIPSVTWICSYYPKGQAFWRWLASKGWDEAQAIKVAAGDKGSKVHKAIESLLDGKEVPMTALFVNPTTEKEEELTLEEYECLMSFVEWWKACKPTCLGKELVVVNREYGYAGTVDLICEVGGERWVIDFKTGQNVWPEHRLQVSAYAHALRDAHQRIDKLGILQIGYQRNKHNYKLTEVEDCFDLFMATRQIWATETAGQKPLKRDYPLALRLEDVKNEDDGATPDRNQGPVRDTAVTPVRQD